MEGSIRFEIDHDCGLFLVHCRGMWSPDQASAHFDRMATAVRAMRMMGRPVHVLVDLRESSVQSQATSTVMAQGEARIHRHADRVAFVCRSALHVLQVKRDVIVPTIAFFEGMDEARAWIDRQDAA